MAMLPYGTLKHSSSNAFRQFVDEISARIRGVVDCRSSECTSHHTQLIPPFFVSLPVGVPVFPPLTYQTFTRRTRLRRSQHVGFYRVRMCLCMYAACHPTVSFFGTVYASISTYKADVTAEALRLSSRWLTGRVDSPVTPTCYGQRQSGLAFFLFWETRQRGRRRQQERTRGNICPHSLRREKRPRGLM